MKISSFKSIVGTTWVLSEGFCVLGYFKSRRAARERQAQIVLERQRRAAAQPDASSSRRNRDA
jgi:hypothetical protein